MKNLKKGISQIAKIASIAVIAIFLPSFTHAQESKGFIEKMKERFAPKKKTIEEKSVAKTEKTIIDSKIDTRNTVTINYDEAYSNMTREEIVKEIKGEIESEGQILSRIPELKKQNDKDGKAVYSYISDGKQINLEGVDEKLLRGIAKKVSNEATNIRNETMMEQRETLDIIRNQDAIMRRPQLPPQPPSAPERASQPPRAPAGPPSPPRR